MLGRIMAGPVSGVVQSVSHLDLRFIIDEPDVSLTDFGLALESAIFAALLSRQITARPRLRGWAVAFFGSAAVASLAGAIDHGFLRRDGREAAHDSFWAVTILGIGATSLALVGTGAEIGLERRNAQRVTTIAAVATAAYALVVLMTWRDFVVAILAYAPAAVFLLGILLRRYVVSRDRASLLGIAAIALAFVAAAVQQLEVGIHSRFLGHNTLYHLVQAISFAHLFAAIRQLVAEPDTAVHLHS